VNRRLGVLVLAAALVACARPACPASKVGPAPSRPFLWTVSRGSPAIQGPGQARLYLYGTFHASGEADIPPAARAALAASPVFVSEVGDIPPDAVRKSATLPRGQSLQTLLGADAWYELCDALSGVIDDENLRHVRPWYAMSLLTAASSDLPGVVMDDALKKAAEAQGARLEFLETIEEQLGLVGDSVSGDDLKQALEERRSMRCGVEALRVAYRAGDETAFKDPLGSPSATQTLLVERNRRWMDQLEGYLRSGGAFVAVGVGHLVGPGGLTELLEARGYHVERVP